MDQHSLVEDSNLLQILNLPDGFGYLPLVLALVLGLAPYLGGSDFGIVKIPAFEASAQRKLRVVGPCLLLTAIIVHVPTSYIDGPYRSSDDSFPSDVVITGSTTGE